MSFAQLPRSMVESVPRFSTSRRIGLAILLLLGVGIFRISRVAVSPNASTRSFSSKEKSWLVSNLQIADSTYTSYQPAMMETYMLEHAVALGWDDTQHLKSTCAIWNDPKASTIHPQLATYLKDLEDYNARVAKHAPVPDIRVLLRNTSRADVCAGVELHPDGLPGIFTSGQLSYTKAGYVEPLYPPMRHPLFCIGGAPMAAGTYLGATLSESTRAMDYILDLSYLVHDFADACKSHTITSRNIFIDMGASLDFHAGDDINKNPAVFLMETFRHFGFPFDHIYAFEVTKIEAENVYAKVPQEYIHSYHWINLPVNPDPTSKQNPLQLLLNDYNEDDFIVVKLDIDTPEVEMAMIHLLLQDPRYDKLIDHFYFEHHVYQNELAPIWGLVAGSVLDSLQLFQTLRQKGIAAHYWP